MDCSGEAATDRGIRLVSNPTCAGGREEADGKQSRERKRTIIIY